jgi:hypothetical protein
VFRVISKLLLTEPVVVAQEKSLVAADEKKAKNMEFEVSLKREVKGQDKQ